MENGIFILLISLVLGLAILKAVIEPIIRVFIGLLKTIIPFIVIVVIGFMVLGTQNFMDQLDKQQNRSNYRKTIEPKESETNLNDILRFVDWEEESVKEEKSTVNGDHIQYVSY